MDLAQARPAGSPPSGERSTVTLEPERSKRPKARAVRAAAARLGDVLGALLLITLAVPLIAVGVVVAAAGGGWPVFFGHVRVGRRGRTFRCWKLRTMRADAEEQLAADVTLQRRYVENGFKLPSAEDPRVLPGGQLLRCLYLDELPQLWNVVRGDMSLVGPRPVVPGELELFGADADALLERRPGVFGEWTSRGRRRPPYPERVCVEMEYVNDPSFMRSVRILIRSVEAVMEGQGEEG